MDDDLSDLADPDLLAEAAASHKLAEAAAAAEAEEAGIDLDPYGAGALNDSGVLVWGQPAGGWPVQGAGGEAWVGRQAHQASWVANHNLH